MGGKHLYLHTPYYFLKIICRRIGKGEHTFSFFKKNCSTGEGCEGVGELDFIVNKGVSLFAIRLNYCENRGYPPTYASF